MKIKLVIMDVDGVLTDGSKIYNKSGLAEYKIFCDKDFTAIKKLRSSSVNVCFLSGDSNINKAVAKNRNIDFFLARNKNKVTFLDTLSQKYSCQPKEMLYVADDIFDIDLLKNVGFSACPADSSYDVKKICKFILKSKAGNNAIMELVDLLYNLNIIPPFNKEKFLLLDSNEKF